MTTIEQLNRDLDTPWTLTLKALADAHEEQGEEVMAVGYRWLADHNRFPALHLGSYSACAWGSQTIASSMVRGAVGSTNGMAPAILPIRSDEMQELEIAHIAYGLPAKFPSFSSPSLAFKAAAFAMGRILLREKAEQEKKEKGKLGRYSTAWYPYVSTSTDAPGYGDDQL